MGSLLIADTYLSASVDYLDAMTPLDDLLFQADEVHRTPAAVARSLRERFVGDAFRFHFDRCSAYRAYCEQEGVSPSSLGGDLDAIPLIPSSAFKSGDVVTSGQLVVKNCLSSGTRGTPSRVARDRLSLERFLGSVEVMFQLVELSQTRPQHFVVLGPDIDEAGDLWFSFVMSLVEVLHPATFHVRDGFVDFGEVMATIEQLDLDVQPSIIGPPALVLDFAQYILGGHPLRSFGERGGYVVTAGGWKRAEGWALDQDSFRALVQKALDLSGPDRIRDCFNMVELNTVLMECERGCMHIPPWLHLNARDPISLRALPPGEEGVIAFADPLATSYPGFVLTDDLGEVHAPDSCSCGRSTLTFRPTRRLRRVEARGCALKIDSAMRR